MTQESTAFPHTSANVRDSLSSGSNHSKVFPTKGGFSHAGGNVRGNHLQLEELSPKILKQHQLLSLKEKADQLYPYMPYGATLLADGKIFFKIWAPRAKNTLNPPTVVQIQSPLPDAETNRKEIVQSTLVTIAKFKTLYTTTEFQRKLFDRVSDSLSQNLLDEARKTELENFFPTPWESSVRTKKNKLIEKLLANADMDFKAFTALMQHEAEWLIPEYVRNIVDSEPVIPGKTVRILHAKYHKKDKQWAKQLISRIPNQLMELHLQQILRSPEIPVMPDYVPVESQEIVLPDEHQMQDRGDGNFYCLMENGPPDMRYMYRLNGTLRPDPYSRYQPKDVHGPSQVVSTEGFPWGPSEKEWKGAPNDRDLLSYRLHIGTFSQKGTFEGAIEHLDQIKALGFNAVELFPPTEFPGPQNWGYDPAYLFAPESAYGGPQGLLKFVQACHQKGLAVILDMVYNHFSPEGNYLNEYDDKFTDVGTGKNEENCGGEPNWSKEEIKQYILTNAKYWLKQYHVDGFRLDLSHKIPNPVLAEIGKIAKNIGTQGAPHDRRHVYLSAEDSRAHDRDSVTSTLGMNARWDLWLNNHLASLGSGLSTKNAATSLNGFANYLKQLKLRKTVIYNESADGMLHGHRGFDRILSARVMNAYLPKDKNQSIHLPNDFHCSPSAVQNLLKDFELSESVNAHPANGEEWKDELYGRGWDYSKIKALRQAFQDKGLIKPEEVPLVKAQTLFTSLLKYVLPGQPLHFMGEEYGAKTPFHFFTSYMDKTPIGTIQIDAKRKGLPDPMRPSTFADSKLDWQKQDLGFFKATQDIINLRKTVRALRQGGRSEMAVDAETYQDGQVMTIHRWGKDPGETKETSRSQVFVVLNRSDAPFPVYGVKFPPGNWREIFNASQFLSDAKTTVSKTALNLEPVIGFSQQASRHRIKLNPWDILIFEKQP